MRRERKLFSVMKRVNIRMQKEDNLLAEQSRAEQSRAEQSRAEQSRAEQSRAGTHIEEYDCLRVTATILVVLGHSVYKKILTDYGGMDYSSFITAKSLVFLVCEKLKVIIYLFHMPLFVTLSGAVFGLSQKKYVTLGNLMKNKAKRLLIPFIVVTVCYSFPLKYVAGYFDESSNLFRDLLVGQIFVQGNTHLWFLPALFLVFVITYLIEKRLNGCSILKLVIFVFLSMISSLVSIKIVAYILEYLLWFYIGMCFDSIRESVNERINRQVSFLCVICTVAVGFIWYITYDSTNLLLQIFNLFLKKCLTFLLCFCTYMVARFLAHTAIVSTKAYNLLLKDSFGIYLYSDPWNYIILAVSVGNFDGYLFDSNIGALVLVTSRFLFTLVISVLVTEILRKSKVKYLY